MPIRTTTIAACPKPDYVPIPDWFREESTVAKDPTTGLDQWGDCWGLEAEELLDRATREVVEEQVRIITEIGSHNPTLIQSAVTVAFANTEFSTTI